MCCFQVLLCYNYINIILSSTPVIIGFIFVINNCRKKESHQKHNGKSSSILYRKFKWLALKSLKFPTTCNQGNLSFVIYAMYSQNPNIVFF